MSVYTQKVLEEIQAERDYQDRLWGTEFDDQNDLDNWIRYIVTYSARAAQAPSEQQRRDMVKVAAIAVAACEAFDRNKGFPPRHYEDIIANG
ncbi:MAG: hypothetical protein ACYSUB_01640 [Planctomycetota bacterium]|jgi:hypothetical protein